MSSSASSSSSSGSPATSASGATTLSGVSACHLGHISLMANRTLMGGRPFSTPTRFIVSNHVTFGWCAIHVESIPAVLGRLWLPIADLNHLPRRHVAYLQFWRSDFSLACMRRRMTTHALAGSGAGLVVPVSSQRIGYPIGAVRERLRSPHVGT